MRYLEKLSIQLSLFVCVFITFYSCNLEKNPTNSINSLSDTNPEVSILNWRIIGPLNDSISVDCLFGNTNNELKKNKSFPIFENLSLLQGLPDTVADGIVDYKKPIGFKSRIYPHYLLAELYIEMGKQAKGKKTALVIINMESKVSSLAAEEMKIKMEKLLLQ